MLESVNDIVGRSGIGGGMAFISQASGHFHITTRETWLDQCFITDIWHL